MTHESRTPSEQGQEEQGYLSPALWPPLASDSQATLHSCTAADKTSRSWRIGRILPDSSEARASAMTKPCHKTHCARNEQATRSCPDSVSYTQDEEFIVSWHETHALQLTIYRRLVHQAVIEPWTSVLACDSNPRVSRWNGKRLKHNTASRASSLCMPCVRSPLYMTYRVWTVSHGSYSRRLVWWV